MFCSCAHYPRALRNPGIKCDYSDRLLELPEGRLAVSNLGKVFWPAEQITKGELLRYYVAVSRFILPAVADRPLVMKRHPNGVAAQAFYPAARPGVSAPLTSQEVHAGVDRRDFTIRTTPARLKVMGDLWAALRESAGADLRRVADDGGAKSRGAWSE